MAAGWEKRALDYAFLGSPLLTIGLPFLTKDPPIIWCASLALLLTLCPSDAHRALTRRASLAPLVMLPNLSTLATHAPVHSLGAPTSPCWSAATASRSPRARRPSPRPRPRLTGAPEPTARRRPERALSELRARLRAARVTGAFGPPGLERVPRVCETPAQRPFAPSGRARHLPYFTPLLPPIPPFQPYVTANTNMTTRTIPRLLPCLCATTSWPPQPEGRGDSLHHVGSQPP